MMKLWLNLTMQLWGPDHRPLQSILQTLTASQPDLRPWAGGCLTLFTIPTSDF